MTGRIFSGTIAGMLATIPMFPSAQIVIQQTDMPIPGDTFRVSMTSTIPVDFTRTGQDTVWDFSMLEAMVQRVDTFVGATATPPEYWPVFTPILVTNLAAPRGNNDFFPGLPVSQYYIFYKNSSTAFTDVGFAFKVMGVPIPARYDVPDKQYQFPLGTTSSWASISSVSFGIPGMFYFHTYRARSSFVDGWGTLITPFGSYETLRVRSDLDQNDSIYIDSLGFGIGVERNITEYKWLAIQMGIPVLQINSDGLMVSATYQDSVRLPVSALNVSLGPDTTVSKGAVITLQPVVTGGVPPYDFLWNTFDTTSSITVSMDSTQTFAVAVVDALNNFGSDQKTVTVVSPGLEEEKPLELEIFPNPSYGYVRITLPEHREAGNMLVTDAAGRILFIRPVGSHETSILLDMISLNPGIYFIRFCPGNRSYDGSIIRLGTF